MDNSSKYLQYCVSILYLTSLAEAYDREFKRNCKKYGMVFYGSNPFIFNILSFGEWQELINK